MTVVVDASVVVAALIGNGRDSTWSEDVLVASSLAAPHFLMVEVANVLRRSERAADISSDAASLAHGDLLALRVELFDYEPLALRIWELRHNITNYDGWYVALAEALDAPLATLDRRLASSPGPTCRFLEVPH